MNLNKLIDFIENTQTELQKRALQTVNQMLTIRNWLIGYYIVEYEQNGTDRAKYGTQLLKRLASEFAKKQIKGLSERNLKLFRKFYFTYPQIGQSVSAQFKENNIPLFLSLTDSSVSKTKILQSPTTKSQKGQADAGQMNFYLNYFKANIMTEHDNPPVGLILCTDKTRTKAKVKYATAGLDNKLFVSQYLVELPSELEIEKFMNKEIELLKDNYKL